MREHRLQQISQRRVYHRVFMRALRALAVLFPLVLACGGQSARQAPAIPPPDDRLASDILLVVAHPDDETAITGYLARAIFDEHRKLAVVYGTRGDAGGNAYGQEQAASLGAVRETEVRRALASFGVMNVWILGAPDTPGQDVLRSLETWRHGERLAEVVRLIRLTRPKVVMTWLPAYVAGENHDDHQAAAVIATEAFDLAGDPTAFPEQISPPRNRNDISNLTEGLHPWQAQKLYFFSDASHVDFMAGKGPVYPVDTLSPARGEPYYKLAAEEAAFHLTQFDTGKAAKEALDKGDFTEFKDPVRLILGKSHVKGNATGDVFEGVVSAAIPFHGVRGYQPVARTGMSIELGGPWEFYRDFVRAHNLDSLVDLLAPEVAVPAGQSLWIPILIHNDTDQPEDVDLETTLPGSWSNSQETIRYAVAPHATYPVQMRVKTPSAKSSDSREQQWKNLRWEARNKGQAIGRVDLRAILTSGGLPQ